MKYILDDFGKTLFFRSRPHSNWYMKPHLHAFSELIYCKKGSGRIVVNGRDIAICEKQLCFIPPHFIHEYFLEDADSVCAVFSGDLIPLFVNMAELQKLVVAPIDVSDLSDVMDEFYKLSSRNLLVVSGYLNLICGRVLDQAEFEDKGYIDSPMLQRVILYISEHYRENITLKGVAQKLNYNEKYVSSQLHQLTGNSFNTFLSSFRVEYAKMLLSTQAKATMASVAYESGFETIKTFNRTFKKITGATPLEYKKRLHTSLHS